MASTELENRLAMSELGFDRPRRCRLDSNNRLFGGVDPCRKSLALDGVVDVLKGYDEYGGGINCSVCGKLYKSRVCFTKHLWEHSIYWDLFDDLGKNQDRVLSIQAALILCGGWQSNRFQDLLVTTPQHHSSNKDKHVTSHKPQKIRTNKRKRYNSGGSDSVRSSTSETSSAPEVTSDIENRYELDSAGCSGDESHHDDWLPSPQPLTAVDHAPDYPVGSISSYPVGSISTYPVGSINNYPVGSIKRRRLAGLPPKKRWMAASIAAESRPN